MNNKQTYGLFVLIGMLIMSSLSYAVETTYVDHSTEKQFKEGKTDNILINSNGELTLALQDKTILSEDKDNWAVNAIAKSTSGDIYVATSGMGLIYKLVKDGEPKILYGQGDNDYKHIFSLAATPEGDILAGTGGPAGALLKINSAGKVTELFKDDDIKYIWAIAVGPAGQIYLATGPTGKVLSMNAKGNDVQTVYEAKEKNILSIALADDGTIYAGGDENGLVYKINPATKKATIAYDTGHGEISSLVLDKAGNIYVATADTSAAKPGATLILSDGDTSRSDSDSASSDSDGESDSSKSDDAKSDDKGGKEIVPAATANDAEKKAPKPSPRRPAAQPGKPAQENEVFKINPQGYVESLFQQKVIILAMQLYGEDQLLLATGNEGKLILLETATGDAVVLKTVESSAQVSALLYDTDGTIIAGCANGGQVLTFAKNVAEKGSYTSEAIDAKQISQWGKLQIEAEIPDKTSVKLAFRSGNTSDPEKGGWSDWSDATDAAKDITTDAAPARFLQYRIDMTGSADISPVVRSVHVAHLIPNLPPQINNVNVARDKRNKATRDVPSKNLNISWKAEDANKDNLSFDLYIRQIGQDRWVRIAKEVTQPKYQWNSLTVGDGRYEVKVEGSDTLSNPTGTELSDSRISSAVVVDNTPPAVNEMTWKLNGKVLTVTLDVHDELSVIGAVDYLLDSEENWTVTTTTDGIYDSQDESVSVDIEIEETGSHILSLRIEDDLGNQVYKTINFSL